MLPIAPILKIIRSYLRANTKGTVAVSQRRADVESQQPATVHFAEVARARSASK